MLSYIVAAVLLANGIYTLEITNVTGTTPPPINCPKSLCVQKSDGNYAYNLGGKVNTHYFVQCSNGNPSCQACWPLSLNFKPECNQCMYSLDDPCYTTDSWVAVPTLDCPDICPAKGHNFRGNIADPNERRHYVGCWDGTTMGCVRCPFPLLFNEPWNACLYNGLHNTQPSP